MKKSERMWSTAFLLLYMVFLSSMFAAQGSLLSASGLCRAADAAGQKRIARKMIELSVSFSPIMGI